MKIQMPRILLSLLFSIFLFNSLFSQEYRILESDQTHLKLEFNFSNKFEVSDILIDGIKFTTIKDDKYPLQKPGDPFLPTRSYEIGLPQNTNAVVTILETEREVYNDKFVIATPDSMDQSFNQLNYNQDVYGINSLFPIEQAEINSDAIFRYIKIASLSIAPFQFNPVQRTLILNKKIVVRVDFKLDNAFTDLISPISDKLTEELVQTGLINPDEALKFLGKRQSTANISQEQYWYNPNKDYYKIYLNNKGVYRITYNQLISSGISPSSGLQDGSLEIYNNGVSLPIDIVDVQLDGLFNSGDYFQFVGGPPTPYDQFTRMNIYNKSNVYWFSYQADSVNTYKNINGYSSSNLTPLITNNIETLRWEKDTSYHHLGYAPNDQRDYWYWSSAEARNRAPFRDFIYWIEDSIAYTRIVDKPDVKIRVGLHGLTTSSCSGGNGHSVTIKFNGKELGVKEWNGQESAVFEKSFYIAANSSFTGDTAQIFADRQKFELIMYGDICPNVQNDQILLNYIEFDYWKWNRTNTNYFYFKSPPNNFQENRYYLFGWMRNNMKIYIPDRGRLLSNPLIANDADKSVYFIDTLVTRSEYYCVADDYYNVPDSIIHNVASDLRNMNNGADYIIITHKNFIPAAERLAQFRSNNISGITSPRIKVVDVSEIYNEFSYGLLDPNALNEFSKYAFQNWQSPAPEFIVLMGDMSYDYRKIFPTSRENFIPSIPYHSIIYGQAPSDNAIVTVSGGDITPDIAIGRISCETMENTFKPAIIIVT